MGQPPRSQPSQLVLGQRQELLGRRRIARFDLREDSGNVAHQTRTLRENPSTTIIPWVSMPYACGAQSGDSIQFSDDGIMEIASAFVINKSDLEGADATEAQLTSALSDDRSGPAHQHTQSEGDWRGRRLGGAASLTSIPPSHPPAANHPKPIRAS